MIRELLDKIRVLLSPADKVRLVLVTLLLSLGTAVELAGIGLLMPVVAVFARPELLDENGIIRWFYRHSPFSTHFGFMLFCCVLVAACFVVKNLFTLFICRVQAAFVFGKYVEFHRRMYRSFLEAPYSFHLKTSPAELNNGLSRIIQVSLFVLMPLMSFLADLLTVTVLAAALVLFSPWVITFCMAVFAAAGFLVYALFRKVNSGYGKRLYKADMDGARLRMNGLCGIREVKLFDSAESFLAGYRDAVKGAAECYTGHFVLGQIPRLFLETAAIIMALSMFSIMLAVGIPGSTVLLTFALLVAVMSRILPAASRMHYNLTQIRQNVTVFNDLYLALTAIPAECAEDSGDTFAFERDIEIRSVTFAYSQDAPPVFRDFSLTVNARQSVALTGATGCGKTTLADLVSGLLTPLAGGIYVDGRNIAGDLRAWRRNIACVPQFIYLADGSIRENVAWGQDADRIDDRKVWQALEMAQAADFVRSLPEGLSAPVGSNGARLSGGQRQRLGIARALYRDPKLLILDEATSALDDDTEAALVSALETLHGKLTIITIAHRMSTVEKCDVRIALDSCGSAAASTPAGKKQAFF